MSDEWAKLHQQLVDELKGEGHVRTPAVERAMLAVPRHLFLPGVDNRDVYRDEAVVTKRQNGIGISSASQPSVVAMMLEQLELLPGQKVLEIGAGTGYNAALISHIVSESGRVFTIDIDDDIVLGARRNLLSAGFSNVEVICRDGAAGWADAAPYDRIVLTVGAWDIAPAWTGQLRTEGLLLLPLAMRGGVQKTVAFRKASGHLESVSVSDCAFMPMRGMLAGKDSAVSLAPGTIAVGEAVGIFDPGRGRRTMVSRLATGVSAGGDEVWKSLSLWLALRDEATCSAQTMVATTNPDTVPSLFQWANAGATFGLIGENGFSVVAKAPGEAPWATGAWGSAELWIASFGTDDLERRLDGLIKQWDAAGRPPSERLRIWAVDKEASDSEARADAITVEKYFMRLLIEWT